MKVRLASLICFFFLTSLSMANGQDSKKLPFQPVNLIDLTLKPLQIKQLVPSSMLDKTRFDAKKLPFFCKMEHQMETTTRFPVRIRLGDVRYVNKLESKD